MKKLLLLLLCMPLIGIGQDVKLDEIIFINGDTIFGKVIEVGLNDITYRYKEEKTNNISKNKDIVKIKYASSGRVQIFEGLKVIEKRKKVLEKTHQVNNNLGEYKKSSHSIMFGLNTNIDKYYYKYSHTYDRTAIGFDLSYSYLLSISSYWRYDSYFTYNSLYETVTWGDLTFGDQIDPEYGFIYTTEENLESTKNINVFHNFFIGQKFGHIHNKMFSTYIGSSIRIRRSKYVNDIDFFYELEERFSFNKKHFIFLNIRTIPYKNSNLRNSNLMWFQIVEPTIGYGIKL